MKPFFLIFALAIAAPVSAQHILRATTQHQFIGGAFQIDSTVFHYGIPSLADLQANRPVFGGDYTPGALYWHFEDPTINYTSADRYFYPHNYDVPPETTLHYLKKTYQSDLCDSLKTRSLTDSTVTAIALYTYDANGNVTLIRHLNQDASTSYAMDYLEFEYDAANRKTVQRYYYTYLQSSPAPSIVDSFFYANSGQLTAQRSYEYSENGLSLFSSYLTDFIYDSGVLQYFDLSFVLPNEPVEPTERFVYSYSNAQPDTIFNYIYENGTLSTGPVYWIAYTYDAGGLPELIMLDYLSTPGSDRQRFEYDTDGFLTAYYTYSGTSQTPSITRRYYYDGATSGLTDTEILQLVIYPNPAGETLNVKTDGAIQQLIVTDLSGKKLIEQHGAGTEIGIGHLPAGTYQLQVVTETGAGMQSFVKL